MPGALVPLVLFPRYTALAGATEFKTAPLDVNDYANAIVNIWRGKMMGATGTLRSTCEESTDQVSWTVCGGTTADLVHAEDTEVQVVAHLQKRWFRLVLEVTANSVACWAVGSLERR